MKTAKKILTLALALVIVASTVVIPSVPTASAAPSITAADVTEWPTVTQTGDVYAGQSITDKLTLSGGKIEKGGEELTGTWSISYNLSTSKAGTFPVTFSFTYVYYGSRYGYTLTAPIEKASYTVKKITLELYDELTATSLKSGDKLGESILVGGTVKSGLGLANYGWAWSNADQVVTESGYYEAYCKASSDVYETLTVQVYVTVSESVSHSKIEVAPSIADFEYDPAIKWENIEIDNGKVVDADTGKEIPGKYVFDSYMSGIPSATTHNVKLRFVPDDPNSATSFRTEIKVKVSQAVCRFVDENGNETIPEITLGNMVANNNQSIRNSVVSGQLKTYPESAEIKFYNIYGTYPFVNKAGTTQEVQVLISCPGAYTYNCKSSIVTIKVNIVRTEYTGNLILSTSGNTVTMKIGEGNSSTNNFQNLDGYYHIYVNGEHYTTTNSMPYTCTTIKSGKYDFKVVYEPKDENYLATIKNEMTGSVELSLGWMFNAKGATNSYGGRDVYMSNVKQGTEITVTAAPSQNKNEKFAKWKVVEGELPKGTDLSDETITVVMPDSNLKIEATYRFSFWLFLKNIFTAIFSMGKK